MGYKKVCFNCRKAFSVYKQQNTEAKVTCPNCAGEATIFNHKFQPPRQNDVSNWKLVEFLKDNGFVYQHVFLNVEDGKLTEAKYPANMKEAQAFITKFRSQANTENNIF